MENIVTDRTTRIEVYKAIRKDYSHAVTLYVKSECWGFLTFGNLASSLGITLSYHLATTYKGDRSERSEHRRSVVRLILMTCKDFWLFKTNGSEAEQKNLLKRRIGGLFLTYIMFYAQPSHPGFRIRIQIDAKDMEELKQFEDKMHALHLGLDGETEGNGFFQSLCVITKRLRSEAFELAVVPIEHTLFDEVPSIRAMGHAEYSAAPLNLAYEYYKHHQFIKSLEDQGRYDAMMPEARLKLSDTVFGKPFMDIVEDLLERIKPNWLLPENRIELTERITKLFGTPPEEASNVALLFLQKVSRKRLRDLSESGGVANASGKWKGKWEPCLMDKALFKEDGTFELEKVFEYYGLTSRDFREEELEALEDCRTPPTQLIVNVPLKTAPAGRSSGDQSDLHVKRARISHDHSYAFSALSTRNK